MVRHLAMFLQRATDTEFGVAKRDVHQHRPGAGQADVDALMGEDNARTVRRLRDILISFGPAAREYANELKSSRNPAVRRAAIDLLRGLGRRRGALPTCARCSTTGYAECSARRCAPSSRWHQRGVSDLEQAVKSGAARTEDTILQSLGAFRDEKSRRHHLLHILTNTPFTAANEAPPSRHGTRRAPA